MSKGEGDGGAARDAGLSPTKMALPVSEGHPLRELFQALVEHTFQRELGLREPARAAVRKDHLIDYVQQGRKSYGLASTFTYPPHDQEAPILKRLSDDFELCMVGLNMVRRQMDRMGSPELRAVRRLLES